MGIHQPDDKAEKAPVSIEVNQHSHHAPAQGHPTPTTLRKLPVSASLRTGIFLESESQIGQTQVHIHHITYVLLRLLKLGNDSIIIRHYSYFRGCKWCCASALMQKLTPISFCKSNALPATGLCFLGDFNLITRLILPQGLAGQMISFYSQANLCHQWRHQSVPSLESS